LRLCSERSACSTTPAQLPPLRLRLRSGHIADQLVKAITTERASAQTIAEKPERPIRS
jgi:hypothetical protein